MSAVTRPRGPLPSRVYWTRRLLVLAIAVGLVVAIGRLLDGSGGGPGESAQVVASKAESTTAAEAAAEPEQRPKAKGERDKRDRKKDKPKKKRLPKPQGPCEDSDVLVTPSITGAHVGDGPIEVVLRLTTLESKACTWEVNRDSVFVTLSSEEGPLWSSQQCRGAIPTESVVPRRDKADQVSFLWSGMESDDECSKFTDWVDAGSYTASAVARGSVTPIETTFVLREAVAPTVTVTPTPTPSPTASKSPEE